jgi:hypothetical protein
MKFQQVIENTVKTQKLRRIRIKFDPHNTEHKGYEAYSGYEGYVLQECEGAISIVVMQPAKDMNPMVQLPVSMTTPVAPVDNKLDMLKNFLISKLGEHLGAMISQVADIIAIETILRDNGISENDLKELYKEFILSNE